jgi:putative drug exporter of the RND superfamily
MGFKNWTESLARKSARHPWLTIGIWAGVLAAAIVLITTLLGGVLTTDMVVMNNPESKQAQTIIDDKLGKDNTMDEMVIVRSASLTADDAEFRNTVESLYSDVLNLGNDVVLGGTNYYISGNESMVSADRHSTLVTLVMPPDSEENIDRVYEATDKYTTGGTFEVFHTGAVSFNKDTIKLAESTMQTGETIGVTAALIVLAIVFGAIAAAFLPIALGVVAIIAALGLTVLVGQAMDLSFMVTNMITMMGLAVGIDYSLFILNRFREERKRGLDKLEAIAATGATASKAVFFSGVTVMLALCGLILFPMSIFKTMGIGAELVVLVAVAAALTLLPAMLSLLGDKVNAWRIPFMQRRVSENTGNTSRGFWAKTTRIIMRVPALSLILTVLLLGAAAFQYTNISTGFSGISGIPDNLRAKQGFIVLQQEFHLGMDSPAVIIIDGDINSVVTQSAIAALQTRIAGDSAFTGTMVAPYPEKDLAIMYAGVAGDPLSKQGMDAVERLRADFIPEAFNGSTAKVLTAGDTAMILDFNRTTSTYTPIIFAFILLLSFVILTLAFRSIVIPATAIVMNMLSVGAAYGLMVLVFQKGFGAGLLGFQTVDMIESWLPLFLFALLFGLSMDYQVFLLSRIKERFQKTKDNSEAVAFGLNSTGRLITGAALIMVAVFGGFALGDMVMFQQMGFGLAIAVLLDATLVRCVLVPATMKILGRHNWYLPRWLAWIPDIGLGERESRTGNDTTRISRPRPTSGKLVPSPVPVRVDEINTRLSTGRLSKTLPDNNSGPVSN